MSPPDGTIATGSENGRMWNFGGLRLEGETILKKICPLVHHKFRISEGLHKFHSPPNLLESENNKIGWTCSTHGLNNKCAQAFRLKFKGNHKSRYKLKF